MALERRNYAGGAWKGKFPTSFWNRVLVLCLLLFSGCGYTLRHRLKDTFYDKRGIFVPVFDNRTEEIGIERIFTNALIRELQSRGEIVLGERKGGALELRGAIGGIGGDPTAYTPSGFRGLQGYRRLPTEYGVSVGISLSLVDLETQKVLWSGGFSGFRRVQGPVDRTHNYEAPSSVGLITQSILESKYTEIAGDIMRDVYDEMVELF